MTIKFSELKLEGEAAAALTLLQGTKAFTAYVATAVENRETAARTSAEDETKTQKQKVDEFRTTNKELKEKLEKFDGFDADEYKRLKSLGSDAAAASEKLKAVELQHEGVVKGLEKERDTLKEQAETLKAKTEQDKFRFDAHLAIQQHNAKYPDVAVRPKATERLVEEMIRHHKMVDGKTVMLDNGREFTTDAGIGSMSDWVNTVGRREVDFMFVEPTGGGATGNSASGAGSKKYADMSEAERVELHRKDPTEFSRLKALAQNGDPTK